MINSLPSALCCAAAALALGLGAGQSCAGTTNAAPAPITHQAASDAHAPSPGTAAVGAPNAAVRPVPSGISSFTPADWKELREAREAALKANPDLVRKASELADRVKAFQKKLDDAMIRANPNVAETITKLEQMTPQMSVPGAVPIPPSRPSPVLNQHPRPVPVTPPPAH